MTIGDFIQTATSQLTAAGISSARLDCLILLEDVIARDRAWILAHPEHVLTSPQQQLLQTACKRRQTHVPLAYIRGWTEFYGRRFLVNEHVLVPRPESETILALFCKLTLPKTAVVVDVGTGSGALAVSAALERPGCTVLATDIDPGCLDLAQSNAAKLGATIHTQQTNLLDGIGRADVVLANLPYVPLDHPVNRAAAHEPRLAIFGGDDGLDLYRRMLDQIDHMEQPPHDLLCEALAPQHNTLEVLANQHHYSLQEVQDLIMHFTANR